MTIRDAAATGAFLSVMVFFGFGTFVLYENRHIALTPIAAQAQLDLEEAHRFLLEAGLTAREARQASTEERQALPQLTSGVQTVVANAGTAMQAATRTADEVSASVGSIATSTNTLLAATTTTVTGLQPFETAATSTLASVQLDTQHLDLLISDSDIPLAIANIKTAGANTSEATAHVAATTADVQQAVHSYLHPTLAQKIYHAIANTGVEVGKFFF